MSLISSRRTNFSTSTLYRTPAESKHRTQQKDQSKVDLVFHCTNQGAERTQSEWSISPAKFWNTLCTFLLTFNIYISPTDCLARPVEYQFYNQRGWSALSFSRAG
jgi:hypothetical protein